MSNRIDGPGGPNATIQVEDATALDGPSLDESVGAIDGADAVQSEALGELEGAVDSVVSEVRAGSLSDPVAITERVIEKLVEVRFGHLGEEVSASVTSGVREALINDPFFVAEVESLIASAMERPLP